MKKTIEDITYLQSKFDVMFCSYFNYETSHVLRMKSSGNRKNAANHLLIIIVKAF